MYLVGEVVGVEHQLHVARFADERLRLFRFAAKHARLPAIGDVRFGVAVDDLQVTALALRRVHQCADFELLEAQPQHPVARRTAEAAKPVRARHRAAAIVAGHLRRADVLVHVHRFVAVVLGRFAGRVSCKNIGQTFETLRNNSFICLI